jgi:hypothetical protein
MDLELETGGLDHKKEIWTALKRAKCRAKMR